MTQIEINISDTFKYSKQIIRLLKYYLNVDLRMGQAMLAHYR